MLPPGTLPDDARLGPLKDLNGYFPFTVSANPEAWKQRAEYVRRQLLVATGLWPMPTKTPANAVVHGKVDRDGYTVEKVYLESYPGFYVTGSLYRPKGKSGKLPGVLSPHGHFPNGRFYETPVKEVREQFVNGAERFDVGGRYPLQARCVQLARMGCVVFMWDMVGYADSQQISEAVAHRFKQRRPEMETPTGWGFFSPQAELHLQSIMGLQTYNSIRVLDWFSELPDVDPKRIGVTGESGGGTQTMLIGALDSRPAVLFPAVMVSTAMQGGCTCENCDYLRIGTGNIEFAAMAAPRPLGMTAADDWTKEIATKGLPELQKLYAMLGVPNLVMAKPLLQFPHNYNYVSRAVMYGWMNDYLKLGLEKPIVEEDFKPLSIAELSVWDAEHPKPKGGPEFERSLLKWMTEDSERQIATVKPTDENSLADFRKVVASAFEVLVGSRRSKTDRPEWHQTMTSERPGFDLVAGLVEQPLDGSESQKRSLPVVCLRPKSYSGLPIKRNARIVIWADGGGKDALFSNSELRPGLKRLLDADVEVIGIDLLYQGEFLSKDSSTVKNRRVLSSRDYAGFTFAYNHPLFSQRVQDLIASITTVKRVLWPSERLFLVGTNGAGPIVAAASAQAGTGIERVAIDTRGFRFANLMSIDDPDFLPGAAKYGDLPAMLALSAPNDLWITGESPNRMELPRAAYHAAGAEHHLTIDSGPSASSESRLVEWLLR